MIRYRLWEDSKRNDATIDYYPTTYPSSRGAAIIFPGGAYLQLSKHTGEGYAQFFNTFGMAAFVVNYRLSPNRFPAQLLDARRAMRFVRTNAEKFGLDQDKILAVGSSAGGHLAALLSTYTEKLDGEDRDETDRQDYMPNGQVLCFPVICSADEIAHLPSFENLLGNRFSEKACYSPDLLVNENTPRAFIWHTSTDSVVSVINSYRYAEALAKHGVPCELHVFPVGEHGIGIAPHTPQVFSWLELLRKWLIFNHFVETITWK